MAGSDMEVAPRPASDERTKPWFIESIDVTAKVLGSIAIVIVAWTANSFQRDMNQSSLASQNRTAGLTLQSQREQAGSQLRAAMFTSLIQPFVGAEKGGATAIPVDREQLLAELLVLNFHEEFDSKPLMERVDKRLASEAGSASASGDSARSAREALRSIARRVADRQISALSWNGQGTTTADRGCEVYWLHLSSSAVAPALSNQPEGCVLERTLGQRVSLKSPDGKSVLDMFVRKPNWEDETVDVSVVARWLGDKKRQGDSLTYGFTLTWFDLPLTDNTILPNGDRFAINLRVVSKMTQDVSLRVIWFPPGYFTPREHPLDSREILGLLGRGKT